MPRILVVVPGSPGSGHASNAKYIYDQLKNIPGYVVHLFTLPGGEEAVKTVFKGDLMPAERVGTYDLVVLAGLDKYLMMLPRLTQKFKKVLHLPPPFCAHLCHEPFFSSTGKLAGCKSVFLPATLPFLPVSGGYPSVRGDNGDYRGYKRRHFPEQREADVHFIVTYVGLGDPGRLGSLEQCEEFVIILNFGKYELKLNQPNPKVVSLKLPRVSQLEFEDCLLRCTTIFPALTDGANTVGTFQALKLPYYDLSPKRVEHPEGGAFLNEGVCDMALFRALKSRTKSAAEFALIKSKAETFYAKDAALRKTGRLAVIEELVQKCL